MLSGTFIRKVYILIYIPVPMTCVCRYYTSARIVTYTGWEQQSYIITICVKFLCHVFRIKNGKYKWMQVDNIYDLISNVHFCHIHHKRGGNIFVTQNKIMTTFLPTINTEILLEINSTNKGWMCEYE